MTFFNFKELQIKYQNNFSDSISDNFYIITGAKFYAPAIFRDQLTFLDLLRYFFLYHYRDHITELSYLFIFDPVNSLILPFCDADSIDKRSCICVVRI